MNKLNHKILKDNDTSFLLTFLIERKQIEYRWIIK